MAKKALDEQSGDEGDGEYSVLLAALKDPDALKSHLALVVSAKAEMKMAELSLQRKQAEQEDAQRKAEAAIAAADAKATEIAASRDKLALDLADLSKREAVVAETDKAQRSAADEMLAARKETDARLAEIDRKEAETSAHHEHIRHVLRSAMDLEEAMGAALQVIGSLRERLHVALSQPVGG